MQLLVIADDFTGSIDTGVQLAKAGIATSVYTFTNGESLRELDDCREAAAVVNIESRHLAAEEAYKRVAAVVERGKKSGYRCLYKKTDSTLRGNVGAELAAALCASGANRLIFIPAFPALGRTTRSGTQFVNGVPLAETEFAQDPFNPVWSSRVADIIARQTEIPVMEFSVEALKSSPDEPCILLADADTQADLERIGAHIKSAEALDCLAGCAGFAGILPMLLAIPAQEIPIPPVGPGRLLVCGSVHPMAEKQCAEAVRTGGYEPFDLAPRSLLQGKTITKRTLQGARSRLAAGGKVLLRVQGGREALEQTRRLGAEFGIPADQVSKRIALGLGFMAAELMREPFAGTLTVFGGDTLQGASQMLNIRKIAPIREITAGVALSLAIASQRRILLISKAGAFGDESVVRRIDAFLDSKEG